MKCNKCDRYGESSCEYAEKNLNINDFVCKHPCVLAAEAARDMAQREKRDIEAKIRKYRDAINPFVKICREVVAAVDAEGEKEGGAE